MNKEEEIAYFRNNVIKQYVDEINEMLKEDAKKLREYERLRYNPNYKVCKMCGVIKPLSEYYVNPLKFKGVFDICKECTKKKARRLNKEHQAKSYKCYA